LFPKVVIPLPFDVEERSPHIQVILFLLGVILHKNLNQILFLWASGFFFGGGGGVVYEDGAWKILSDEKPDDGQCWPKRVGFVIF